MLQRICSPRLWAMTQMISQSSKPSTLTLAMRLSLRLAIPRLCMIRRQEDLQP